MIDMNLILFGVCFLITVILISLIFTNLYANHIYKGIRQWLYGSVLFFFAVLIYSFDPTQTQEINFIFGNTAVAFSMVLFSHGTTKFLDHENDSKELSLLYLVVFGLLCVFKYINNQVEIRQVLMSFYVIYAMLRLAFVSFKYFDKPGFNYLKIHFALGLGISILHTLRIVLILLGIAPQTSNLFGVKYDELILASIALYITVMIAIMTVYINYKSTGILKNERHNLELESMTDYLTQLPNRRMLQSYLSNLMSKHKRFALIITDVDGFKDINDQYGHDIGDLVLKEYARVLNQHKRQQDFIARYGGDEFIIVIDDYETNDTLEKNLKSKLAEVATGIEVASIQFRIKTSVGVALYPTDGLTLDELFKKADSALYHVKSNGKNQIAFYQDIKSERI